MRQPALLQVTSLLLLLLGCEGLPCAYDYSPGHSIHLPERVERNWFCPQCRQFNARGDFCNHCAGKREYTEQFLNQETAALIAYLERILEQVKKGDWADFLTQHQHRNWICNQCMYYNELYYNERLKYSCHACYASKFYNQVDQEQASLVACLTHLLGRLREDGIAPPSSQKRQKRWVCSLCNCFNVAGEHTCKGCPREYRHSPWSLEWEQTAFMAYVANVVSRFEEDQTAWQEFRQHEPSGDASVEEYNAFNQKNQPPSNPAVTVHEDWVCHDTPESNIALQEACCICCEQAAFKKNGACKCPQCNKYFCQACYKNIVRAAQQAQTYNYGNSWLATYQLKMQCPLCCKEIPVN